MKQFDFFEELNGREIFHYQGTPCFIVEHIAGNNHAAKIMTMEGVELTVKTDELESPNPDEMTYL